MKKFALIAALFLFAISAQAQTPVLQVPVNQPFSLQWDWVEGTGGPVQGFRVELNGVQVADIDNLGGNVAVLSPSTTCGTNTLRVGAYNPAGVAWSAPLTYQVTGCPPSAPTNLRIVVSIQQQADGSYNLKLEQVVVK